MQVVWDISQIEKKISIFAKEGLLARVEDESMVNGQEYFDDS